MLITDNLTGKEVANSCLKSQVLATSLNRECLNLGMISVNNCNSNHFLFAESKTDSPTERSDVSKSLPYVNKNHVG